MGSMADSAYGAGGLGHKGDGAQFRRAAGSQAPAPPPVQISIRTEFPDTAFWHPHLHSPGAFSTSTDVPDSMAEQEVIIVASDKKGGVGVTRKTVRVTQPLFAQAQLPNVLRAGDQLRVPLLVRNTTKADLTASVTVEAPGITMSAPTNDVVIPAQGQAIVPLEILATTPGAHLYTITVLGGRLRDIVTGTLRVYPSGIPQTTIHKGWTAPTTPFTHTFTIPLKDTGNQVSLHVMMPAMTSAFAGIQDFNKIVHQSPLALTTDLTSAALTLQYATQQGIASEALTDLKGRVLQSLASLHFAQLSDGSFAYWRGHDTGSAYVTAWAIEGMLEAQQLDFPVPQEGCKASA